VREFAKLGLTRSVGGVLALALARELTPVVTAIILAGRVGSAFAAELGTMQVGDICMQFACGQGLQQGGAACSGAC
jgi:ABC-type transporter Mla maintaining outer membrane lipid asymmetry permease subunit MlaE